MMLGFPLCSHDMSIHTTIAVDAEMSVLRKAIEAISLGDSALPPLKPNQPNHSSAAPRATKRTSCGAVRVWRLPSTEMVASAAMPAEMCTTVPPAKSIAPSLASRPPPHTEWARTE